MRTPLLIREYLGGSVEFPGDSPGDPEARVAGGDYVSRMHRKVKARIREISPEYQYPRSASFLSLINALITIGLVEKTGRREDPEERGAGIVGVAGGFERRTWVALTEGSAIRIEWSDPIGHLARIYPNVRPSGRALPGVVPAAAEPQVPTITLPARFSTRSVPRLVAHFEQLVDLAEQADWPERTFPALAAEAQRLLESGEAWMDAAQESLDNEEDRDSPNEDRLEALGGRVEALQDYVNALEDQDLSAAVETLIELAE